MNAAEQLDLFAPQVTTPRLSFTDQMGAAKDADQGRDIIHAHEEAISALEQSCGFKQTVGIGGSGFGGRGFSTVSKKERAAMVKRLPPEKRAELLGLIADGDAMEEPWKKLLAKEWEQYKIDHWGTDEKP